MTHDDNPVPPADDATTPLPEAFIDPTPQADTPTVDPSPVDTIPFDEAPTSPADEAPLPEMALEPLASPEPTPVPEERGHSSFAPEDPSSAAPTMTANEECPLSSSAQAPAEDPTVTLLTEPAPADLAAIAAVASLSTPHDPEETNSDNSYFSSHEAPAPSSTLHPPSSSSHATPPRRVLSGGWTMGLLLSGIAIIAACVLIPQGDETRKLMYERESLRADLEQVQKQVTTNDEFLKKVQSDPTLAERLAQRQMKLVPAGTKVLDVDDASPTKDDKSPFLIVSVPPPAPMPPYHPRGGTFAQLCRNGRSQLYMIGGGLLLVAAGLVLGVSGTRD